MSYYKTIDGKQMDNRLLDIALQAVEGVGDGRISQHDAEKLFEAVKDANVYTLAEKNTIAYIREHFKWTDSADHWFRSQISHWRSPSGKLTMSPSEIVKEHLPSFDVLRDVEQKKIRKHDLITAMNETNVDHDDIGLIIQLATGECVEVLCNFIEMSDDFVELRGGCIIPVHVIEKVEI
jgi:hypothetical protein